MENRLAAIESEERGPGQSRARNSENDSGRSAELKRRGLKQIESLKNELDSWYESWGPYKGKNFTADEAAKAKQMFSKYIGLEIQTEDIADGEPIEIWMK